MNTPIIFSVNYTVDLFNYIIAKLNTITLKIGYNRAAGELSRMGYPDLAARCRELARQLDEQA